LIQVADYVVDSLVENGITDLFLVSGGGIMHLLDAVGRNPRMRYVCNYHEQASAIAAEAYARVRGGVGACLVTTGPGSANALSGIVGAWFDSIPVLVLSGQVRTPLLADYERMRQLGPQEINIVPMVRPVTKYAVTVRDPGTIRSELETALAAARGGRPGPVWLDLPLDVQAAIVDETALSGMLPASGPVGDDRPLSLERHVARTIEMLKEARRPVLVLGNGVRLAGMAGRLTDVLARLQVPVLLPIGGMDLVPDSYSLHLGAFGPVGRRASNFALQNADLMLSVGAGLAISAIGFNAKAFAPRAKKILVNVDPGELEKGTVTADLAIAEDARVFFDELLRQLEGSTVRGSDRWLQACSGWKRRYPAVTQEACLETGWTNTYAFVDRLSDLLENDDIVVTGNSLDACTVYQAFRVKKGQRVLINVNCGAMGWDLPAAVGAAIARRGRVVLVTGDGSFQFNVQELQTLRQYNLSVKIFVLNNDGYESIRATQTNYFQGRFVGSDRASGVGNPDFRQLAAAYGLAYERVASNAGVDAAAARLLASDGPALCEVLVSPVQGRNPKLSSFKREDGTLESRPLEDMFPFLPREEIHANMHLFDDEEQP